MLTGLYSVLDGTLTQLNSSHITIAFADYILQESNK